MINSRKLGELYADELIAIVHSHLGKMWRRQGRGLYALIDDTHVYADFVLFCPIAKSMTELVFMIKISSGIYADDSANGYETWNLTISLCTPIDEAKETLIQWIETIVVKERNKIWPRLCGHNYKKGFSKLFNEGDEL